MQRMHSSASKSAASPKRLAREKLAASSDPLRQALLTELSHGPASASDLAEVLEVDPARVRYQIRRMREVGLVELVGETRRLGPRENLYSADPSDCVLDDADLTHLSPAEIEQAIAGFVRLMFRESRELIATPPREDREDSLARVPLSFDEKGWGEAVQVHRQLLAEMLEVRERSIRRLEQSGEESLSTLAMILFFNLTPERQEVPEDAAGER
jgi:DNA-binding transcriptional ArsR family regulator